VTRHLADLLIQGLQALGPQAIREGVQVPPTTFLAVLERRWGLLLHLAPLVLTVDDWRALEAWQPADTTALLQALVAQGDLGVLLWAHEEWFDAVVGGLRERLLAAGARR